MKVNRPTYFDDIVEKIHKVNEADNVFGREELFRFFGTHSSQYMDYYARHPELTDTDKKVNEMPDRARSGGIDQPMHKAMFYFIDRISSENHVDGKPGKNLTEISPDHAQKKVKAMARLMGADLVGTGPLRQEWTYTQVGRSRGDREGYLPYGTQIDLSTHSNAIALGFAMDRRLVRCAPDFPLMLGSAAGYSIAAWVTVQLAEYIRRLGYSARAHHLSNYQVLAVPIAVDCGLGELSRAGFLLTKEYGLGVRLSVVTTNMPMAHDQPVDIGVQSFCKNCRICADNCPIGAIPSGEKVVVNGSRRWKIDENKCFKFWHSVGSDCGICLASCPWTRPEHWFHKLIAEVASIKGVHQGLMVKMDNLFRPKYVKGSWPGFLG